MPVFGTVNVLLEGLLADLNGDGVVNRNIWTTGHLDYGGASVLVLPGLADMPVAVGGSLPFPASDTNTSINPTFTDTTVVGVLFQFDPIPAESLALPHSMHAFTGTVVPESSTALLLVSSGILVGLRPRQRRRLMLSCRAMPEARVAGCAF